jgi:hypothetical protein
MTHRIIASASSSPKVEPMDRLGYGVDAWLAQPASGLQVDEVCALDTLVLGIVFGHAQFLSPK